MPDDPYAECWDSPQTIAVDVEADDSEQGFLKRWAAEQRRDVIESFLESRVLVWCPDYVADLARQDMRDILAQLSKKPVLKNLKAPEARVAEANSP